MEEYPFPEQEGLLAEPRIIPGTDISVIRGYDGRRLRVALLDWDGNISTLKDTWPDIMAATNAASVVQGARNFSVRDAVNGVLSYTGRSIGEPTYLQMKYNCLLIDANEGEAADPSRYKEVYNIHLKAQDALVRNRIKNGGMPFSVDNTPSERIAKIAYKNGKGYLLLSAIFTGCIAQAYPTMSVEEANNHALGILLEDLSKTPEKNIIALTEFLNSHGGNNLSPNRYHHLFRMIHGPESMNVNPYQQAASVDDFLIPGARNLLQGLNRSFEGRVYIASGSDVEAVRIDAALLGLDELVADIVGAGSSPDPRACAKRRIIEKFKRGEVDDIPLQRGELAGFEDGFPENLWTYVADGIAVGMLSPDHSLYENEGHFTVEQKRARLTRSGSHVLVNSYRHALRLIEEIRKNAA